MKTIDWEVPAVRSGWQGWMDRFVGPGATDAELWVQLVGGILIALGAAGVYFANHGMTDGVLPALLVVILCLDLGGGVVTNATGSAKRWYHRAGQDWRAHMRFVALHGVHVIFVALVWSDQSLFYFVSVYGLLLTASAIVLAVPLPLQRPVAMTAYGLALLAAQSPVLAIEGFGWFLPLLFLKLLVCHLVVEAPFAARRDRG